MRTAGSIDETGYLKGYTRRGYTPARCILELAANTLDSKAKNLTFDINRSYICAIDNGVGMDMNNSENMFAMHRENHSNDASRGVSGIGAKPALSILSEQTTVYIYSHKQGDQYIKITVPWDIIHGTGQYTGMITISEMNEDEKKKYIEERTKNNMVDSKEEATGTTIEFIYNDKLSDIINENFINIDDANILKNPLDRIDCVFGRENITIMYSHYEDPSKVMKMYNYFEESTAQYYKGIKTSTIEQWSFKGKTRFHT